MEGERFTRVTDQILADIERHSQLLIRDGGVVLDLLLSQYLTESHFLHYTDKIVKQGHEQESEELEGNFTPGTWTDILFRSPHHSHRTYSVMCPIYYSLLRV